MARFNLDDYETVESRIKKFYEQNPDGRIVTKWLNDYRLNDKEDTYIVKASIYLTAGDQANKLPKATGLAVEITGTGGANNGSALENAETSAIGRALANMNLSGNKRASREEMEKVVRNEAVTIKGKLTEAQASTALDFLAKLDELTKAEEIRQLYNDARRANAPKEVLDKIATKGKTAK